jgi:GNAT superfamily N-acetyltransferase
MQIPPGAPEWLAVYTAAEQPGLWDKIRSERLFNDVWPAYNHHGNNSGRYFSALVPRHAAFQILFVDSRSGRPVARGRTIPFRWDGTLDDLPTGIDAVGLRAVDEPDVPTALSALAAEVDREYQGSGLSGLLIQAMRDVARNAGLTRLVAPVRPNWKDRYPLIPIDQYAGWRRDDGLPFDPWMRLHVRVGGRMLRAEPNSMEITAPVQDWESWTGMAFPIDGEYVFPGGLSPLAVSGGIGSYWEPNIWMAHDV